MDGTIRSTSLQRVEAGQSTPSCRCSLVIYRTLRHHPVMGGHQRHPVADHRRRRCHGCPRLHPARWTTHVGVFLETHHLEVGCHTSTVAIASSSWTTAPSSSMTSSSSRALPASSSTHRRVDQTASSGLSTCHSPHQPRDAGCVATCHAVSWVNYFELCHHIRIRHCCHHHLSVMVQPSPCQLCHSICI